MSDEEDIFSDLVPVDQNDVMTEAEEEVFAEMHGTSNDSPHDSVLKEVGFVQIDTKLSLQEMNFAVKYAETGDAASSYRYAFKDHDRLTPESLRTMASRLAKRPNIAEEIAKQRQAGAKMAALTLPTMMEDLIESVEIAKKQQDSKSIQSGIKLMAEFLGAGKANESKNRELDAKSSFIENVDTHTIEKLRRTIADNVNGGDIIDITPTEGDG